MARLATDPDRITSLEVLFGALYAYTLPIDRDFSGYTGFAIGSARPCRFRIPENFDLPCEAPSVASTGAPLAHHPVRLGARLRVLPPRRLARRRLRTLPKHVRGPAHPRPHRLQVFPTGDGPVRLFGVGMERGTPGVPPSPPPHATRPPDSACVLTGPSGRARKVTGPGSLLRWWSAVPTLATGDLLHFSAGGYQELARRFVAAADGP